MDNCRYLRYSDIRKDFYQTKEWGKISLLGWNWSRPYEYPYMIKAVDKFTFPNCSVLDLGSGNPKRYPFAIMLADSDQKYKVTVQDIDFEKQEKLFKKYGIEYHRGNIASLPYKDNSFHTFTSISVFEHLEPEDFFKTLKEGFRVLRTYGGTFLVTVDVTDDYNKHLSIYNNLEKKMKEQLDPKRIIEEFEKIGFKISDFDDSKENALKDPIHNLCIFYGRFVKI